MRLQSKAFIKDKLSSLTPVKYNRFQWWRNYKFNDTLSPMTSTLSKIRNGEFEHSPYYWMAQEALVQAEEKVAKSKSLEEQRDALSLYMEKYRRLQEDYEKDEFKRITAFKKEVTKRLRIPITALEEIMESYDGTIEELYVHLEELYLIKPQPVPKFKT